MDTTAVLDRPVEFRPGNWNLFKFIGWDGQVWSAGLAEVVVFNARDSTSRTLLFDFRTREYQYHLPDGSPGYRDNKIRYLAPDGTQMQSELLACLSRHDGKVVFLFRHWPDNLPELVRHEISYQAPDGRNRQWGVLEGKWMADRSASPGTYFAAEAECADKVPGWGVNVNPPPVPRI